MWDGSSIDVAECRRKVASGRKIANAIRALVNSRGMQLEYARLLQEALHEPSAVWQLDNDIERKGETWDLVCANGQS